MGFKPKTYCCFQGECFTTELHVPKQLSWPGQIKAITRQGQPVQPNVMNRQPQTQHYKYVKTTCTDIPLAKRYMYVCIIRHTYVHICTYRYVTKLKKAVLQLVMQALYLFFFRRSLMTPFFFLLHLLIFLYLILFTSRGLLDTILHLLTGPVLEKQQRVAGTRWKVCTDCKVRKLKTPSHGLCACTRSRFSISNVYILNNMIVTHKIRTYRAC